MVYRRVRDKSGYAGAKKLDNDPKAYERMYTTSGDEFFLDDYFLEAKYAAQSAMKQWFRRDEKEEPTTIMGAQDSITWVLEVSESFDTALGMTIGENLTDYFVASILSKWYAMTSKEEAGAYAEATSGYLECAIRNICYKKKPTRPVVEL